MAGDFVFLHEGDEFRDGDAAVSAAGDSVAFQELFVEPLADRSACYVTDFCHFACRQDFFALCHNLSLLKKERGYSGRGKTKKSTAAITLGLGPREPLRNAKADDALSIAEYG